MVINGLFLKETVMKLSKKSNYLSDLTIVIPALHEEKRIGKTLDSLAVYLKNDTILKKISTEVLVVSADSLDKTHDIVIKKQKQFSNLKLLKPGKVVGKGRDVAYGMLRAEGKIVVFMDADLATPLKYLTIFYKTINNEKIDILIGTRNLHNHHKNITRILVSNLGNLLFRIAGGVWVEDSQCGFKMFTNKASKLCFSRLTVLGWGFDMEILTIAKINHFVIKNIRINDWVSVDGGTFDDGIIKNSVRSLKELRLIFINRLKGLYKLSNKS